VNKDYIIALLLVSLIVINPLLGENVNLDKPFRKSSIQELELKAVNEKTHTYNWITASKVTVAITPDGSFSLIKEIISKANSYIYIEIYQFWSDDIFNLINQTVRSKPTLEVRILIENDTGRIGVVNNPDKFNMHYAYLFYQLNQSGYNVEVRLETSSTYYHGKLIIVDNRYTLISSDNLIPTSFPANPKNIERPKYGSYYYYDTPSRGWVALIDDPTVTSFYLDIFNSDFSSGEIYDPNIHGTGVAFDSYSPISFSPLSVVNETVSNVKIKPVASPFDSWGNITDLLERANHTILIEQMYIYESAWDLVNILENLHKNKKVTVYVILEDNYPGNYADIKDNLTKLGFHVVPAFNVDESIFLHNKGIIVDDKIVFVGSINWSGGSFNKNREYGVIIESREVASFLRSVYGFDWDHSKPSSDYPFDSDGDGLPDYYEIEHGLNRLNKDTDGDGFTDYEEVYIKGTDPTKPNIIQKNTFTVYEPINETITRLTQVNISIHVNSTIVKSLEVYLNGQKKKTISVPEVGWYNFTLGTLDYGLNTIEIVSKDYSNDELDKAKLVIELDNLSPEIELRGVVNNSIYEIGDKPMLTWNVSDDHIDTVEVSLDGDLKSLDINGSLVIDTRDPKLCTGPHNISIKAIDKAGNINSKIIYFSVDKPKITSLTATPLNGSKVYQEEFEIKIDIEIKVVNITNMRIKSDGSITILSLISKQGEKWTWGGKITLKSSVLELEIETTHYTFHFKLIYNLEKNPVIRFIYTYRYEIVIFIILIILFILGYVRRR